MSFVPFRPAVPKFAVAMKSTSLLVRPHVASLVCSHCGMVALPGTLGWRALTAVSHAGPTLTSELAGHEVALDLCRHCLRDALKAALGIGADCADPAAACLAADTPDPLRWVSDADDFIRASNARLEAWRRAEFAEDSTRGGPA